MGSAWLVCGLVWLMAGCGTPAYVGTEIQYANPDWAPTYVPGVRYYYFPDIEAYYDLSDQEFVYLDNGQWLFSPQLPGLYAGFDLYSGFVVSLDWHVYQPWMHHQFYVSHYPRYYYRSYYPGQDYHNLRGFDENYRKPFYRGSQGLPGQNLPRGLPRNQPPAQHPVPQPSRYYGKPIGRPVRVTPQMRPPASSGQSGTGRQPRTAPKRNF